MRLNTQDSALSKRSQARRAGGIGRLLRKLRRSENGVTMVEFALIAPMMAFTIVAGTELAYYASVQMQISQIAISVADNASRLGQTDNSSIAPSVTEEQIDSLMYGAMQQGAGIDIANRGRIILSSLELNEDANQPEFHWQRCQGKLVRVSNYGAAGYIGPVGPANHPILPTRRGGVMVAEVYYSYQPLLANSVVGNVIIKREGVFLVRDGRNYGKWNSDGVAGKSKESKCNKF